MKTVWKPFLFSFMVALTGGSCRSVNTIEAAVASITRLAMQLSASGVEADDFPSIKAFIRFENDSSRCEKTYDNPSLPSSNYQLSGAEIRKIVKLLQAIDFQKLKTEYRVSKTDQPTSITTIYVGQQVIVIKDYGLDGADPLKELYKIVYKY